MLQKRYFLPRIARFSHLICEMILWKFTNGAHQLGWEGVRPLETRHRPPQVILHIIHVSGRHSLADGLAGGVPHHLLRILQVSRGHSLAEGLACGVSHHLLHIFQLRRPRI
jgi:hypothetical protein